ncbi:MAG: hypothetical protein LC781_09125, partial [Actinobacteria bacterium]|nr:hypothetical protein [Actinomycetota bacterium]
VRNFVPQYNQVVNGEWDIAGLAKRSYDLEGKTVGIYGAGAIGQLVAMRLKPFDVKMYYYKRSRLSNTEEAVCGFRYVRLDDMMAHCDVIVIEAPLTPETEGLFDRDVLFGMKKGAWLVNTARGAIVDRDALVEALEEGHLAGYAGDVWDPEPAPPDHPWRTMPHHMMTPHTAGTTLDAQKHYAEDTRRCLEAFFAGEEIEDDHLIVEGGEIVSGTYKAIYEASESQSSTERLPTSTRADRPSVRDRAASAASSRGSPANGAARTPRTSTVEQNHSSHGMRWCKMLE